MKPSRTNTQWSLNNWGESAALTDVGKRFDFLVFSDKGDKP